MWNTLVGSGNFTLEKKSKERPGNAIDNNVLRNITEPNPWQTAGETAFRMKVSYSIC